MLNQQPPELPEHSEDGSLDVVDVWHTIQGEGPHVGRPAVFVRLAGCNIRCPLCDTNYTTGRCRVSLEDLVLRIAGTKVAFPHTSLVVITGGEPFRQNIHPLIVRLLPRYTVQVETNGTANVEYEDQADIVVSPKAVFLHASLRTIRPVAYKYVVDHRHICPADGLPETVLGRGGGVSRFPHLTARPLPEHKDVPIYVQPMDVQDPAENKLHMDAAVRSCLDFGYRLCLQVHKFANLP